MTLLALVDAELAFGLTPLLDRASLTVSEGERIGLIGRNGTGKSALLGAIAGQVLLEDGRVERRAGLVVAHVEQEPVLPRAATLRDSLVLRGGFEERHDDGRRWRLQTRLDEFLGRFGLVASADPASASGGERKRGALALAFALEPDLLLLDEPTTHLDIGAIGTLEELLRAGPTALVVTHDRFFLDRVTTRIVELDRGWLRSYPGSFSAYLARKGDELAAEAVANRKFDRFWAQEEAWIRRGVEARRTRDEGRVRRLERLRLERAARRERLGAMQLNVDARDRSGKLVAELVDVGKRFGARPLIAGLTLRILRGDRIGLLGANGAGKSTLLRLILGELAPDCGSVRLGTNLQVAYFDQLREQLDLERTVAETVSPGSEWVEVNGARRHLSGYLGDFLFSPQRAATPVKALSGGERNRLLLARLFARPANVLVLDEPTNDLDIESLELLEAALQEFPGTLLLVSHDRAFVDNVVTQTLAPLGDGRWQEYVGGYSDWLRQRPQASAAGRPAATARRAAAHAAGPGAATRAPVAQDGTATAPATPGPASAGPRRARARLSYKAQRELEALPAEIAVLEAEQRALVARMGAADYHLASPGQMAADGTRVAALEALLLACLERWEALEAEAARAGTPAPG